MGLKIYNPTIKPIVWQSTSSNELFSDCCCLFCCHPGKVSNSDPRDDDPTGFLLRSQTYDFLCWQGEPGKQPSQLPPQPTGQVWLTWWHGSTLEAVPRRSSSSLYLHEITFLSSQQVLFMVSWEIEASFWGRLPHAPAVKVWGSVENLAILAGMLFESE